MTEMNKETAKSLQTNVEKLLQGLPKEFTAKVGGGSYNPTAGTLTMKITISIKALVEAPDAYKRTPEYYALKECVKFGLIDLKPDMLEKIFDIGGVGPCRLIGYKSRASKYPFVVECLASKKKYRTSEISIKHAVRLSQ